MSQLRTHGLSSFIRYSTDGNECRVCSSPLPCMLALGLPSNSAVFRVHSLFRIRPSSHWFSRFSVSYEFNLPPFVTWLLVLWACGAPRPLPLFALLSLAASCRFPCCFSLFLFPSLSQPNKDCLERAAALSFEQKIPSTSCRLAIDLFNSKSD